MSDHKLNRCPATSRQQHPLTPVTQAATATLNHICELLVFQYTRRRGHVLHGVGRRPDRHLLPVATPVTYVRSGACQGNPRTPQSTTAQTARLQRWAGPWHAREPSRDRGSVREDLDSTILFGDACLSIPTHPTPSPNSTVHIPQDTSTHLGGARRC